MNMHVCTAFHY